MVKDADPQCHEGLGEIYDLLPHVGDSERGNGKVSHLVKTKNIKQRPNERITGLFSHVIIWIGTHMVNEFPHHAVPLPLVILSTIFAI